MIKIVYHLIVLFLTINLIWYLFREKQFWAQVSTAIVLIMFLLRLFLIK
ncbi:MAG: hypothetical protein PVI66_11225 [Candidatus Aminicenantes bacterium]|jgi:hypothetical protein